MQERAGEGGRDEGGGVKGRTERYKAPGKERRGGGSREGWSCWALTHRGCGGKAS